MLLLRKSNKSLGLGYSMVEDKFNSYTQPVTATPESEIRGK
jgi:hypothetical protein